MSVLEKLTEGIVNRSLAKDGQALLTKWENTGLLEGLGSDNTKNSMACLLENQAKELLREASAMSQGDVEGFAAVAFPIVRRVFGGLIANDLVSVQPMSFPSGLIFFLAFQHPDTKHTVGASARATSVYGGSVVGKGIADGVGALSGTGFYDLQSGYASPTGSVALGDATTTAIASMSDNTLADKDATSYAADLGVTPVAISALNAGQKLQLRFDPDVLAATSAKKIFTVVAKVATTVMADINTDNLVGCTLTNDDGTPLSDGGGDLDVIRRLTHLGYKDADNAIVAGSDAQWITFYCLENDTDGDADNDIAATATLVYPVKDAFSADSNGAVSGGTPWGLETTADTNLGLAGANLDIPEIDIKVDSIAVTAITKKLKAKWTPELGQDLNAYHNLDAEVELTGILSEQIALEIDQEILNDLVQGATAGTLYWSRRPGQFLDPEKGTSITSATAPPDFTGTVSEWYETLVETINDVSARIHRKTLRGGANFLVCGPEVANILEFTSGFRANITADDDKGTVGAVNAGSISKKWDVWVDPYFPRNVVLVGRKGSSFLESGFVYAPYVPLQVTPTIFGTEDFLPRKGVMTRYAKKMVRPDMYGLVIVRDLIG